MYFSIISFFEMIRKNLIIKNQRENFKTIFIKHQVCLCRNKDVSKIINLF